MQNKTQEQIDKEIIEGIVSSPGWAILKRKFEDIFRQAVLSVDNKDRELLEIGAIVLAKEELAGKLNEFLKELDLMIPVDKKELRTFR